MGYRDIIGHERPVGILRGIIRTGKVPTSYLFAGEKGIGKMMTAVNFAKAMNCENREDGAPCDRCASCQKTEHGTHPDLRIAEPDGGVIKVEQIRELEEFLTLTPYEGSRKIVIIDDADRMNTFAANAFLKTLEEPPEESVIILVSSREDLLPDTIRSRCLKLKFSPLSEGELKTIVEVNHYDHARGALGLAMGRVGLLSDEDMVRKRDGYFELFHDMVRGQEVSALKDKEAIEELLDYYMIFLRDIAVMLFGEGGGLVNADREKDLAGIARRMDRSNVVDVFDHVQDLKKKMFFNLNKTLVFNYLTTLLALAGTPDKKSRP